MCHRILVLTLPIIRFNHACLSFPREDDYIVLVAGGETWDGSLTSVEQYSRSGDQWRRLSPLPEDRAGAALVLSLGKPRLMGGYSEERGGPTHTIYSLNMEAGQLGEWEEDEATLELPTEKTYALTIVPSNLRIL